MAPALDLKGIIPATLLPLAAAHEVDEAGLRKDIRWIAAQGIVAVAVSVDTGEGPRLWYHEKLRRPRAPSPRGTTALPELQTP